MNTYKTKNKPSAIHGRLQLPVLLPVLASLVIAGCAAPMDARKDTKYQSNASVADRPTSRPTRSLSSMSPSLMCMDHMFRQADLPTTLITSKQIPDVTGKIAVATKDTEVLLGAIPMEDMDVVLDMKNQKMDINPDSPYYASMKMK